MWYDDATWPSNIMRRAWQEGKRDQAGRCFINIYIHAYVCVYIYNWLVVSNMNFIFHNIYNIWDNPSHWLIFFKMVQTTNQIYIYICIVLFRVPTPPNGMGPQVATSICKLSAAFLRSSLVFARFLQRFWLPASHLVGTCYLLDDLRSTHTPSNTYVLPIVIYTFAMYLLPIYTNIYIYTYYRQIHK